MLFQGNRFIRLVYITCYRSTGGLPRDLRDLLEMISTLRKRGILRSAS